LETALFIAHEYHPGAETLEQKFPTGEKAKPGGFISEESLWSFIIQLVSAIRTVHASGLAVRTLVASKVLLTGKNRYGDKICAVFDFSRLRIVCRIRISGVGLDDVLNPASRQVSLQVKQAEDVVLLGKLILRLACASADHSNPSSLPRALESISTSYSAELHSFTLRLMGLVGANRMKLPVGSPPAYPALDELLQLLAPKMVTQIDRLYGFVICIICLYTAFKLTRFISYCDTLETELIKEVENGRLFRLVVKLGFINERPDYDVANQWSETEDRYLLKLFRDFVFHQVDEDAAPVLDFSHVVEALNKLDIGVEEKILLTSRDEKYMLVLRYDESREPRKAQSDSFPCSYKELRRCLNEAFNELVQRQQAAETTQQQQPSTQVSQPAAQHNFYMTR
jgi:PAB-dependent poly(A)-specific ribonuclease subunit 3